jgi:four helix bundle protein
MKTHKDLEVWKKSIDLVTYVYKITKDFPKEELYGLTTQMRRSAISIPSNIAEGAARKNIKEFIQFLYVALGSFSELETQLIISKNLYYLKSDNLSEEYASIGKMLISLIKYYRGS